ncbi:hypothetical protein PHJA_002503500 [Phtheirospermum japonicum]|uniref:Uncharacterized protein n=1 Tax=Phtheirospermum japonicum TaxID=374723 RepID=A0A830CWK2_9LAMI|nr:hypothetical protein PHJA_002503500 [Phtheirospermum japonicum]
MVARGLLRLVSFVSQRLLDSQSESDSDGKSIATLLPFPVPRVGKANNGGADRKILQNGDEILQPPPNKLRRPERVRRPPPHPPRFCINNLRAKRESKSIRRRRRLEHAGIHDHLRSSSNYIPPLDFDEENVVDDYELDDFSPGSSNRSKSNDIAEEDPLFDDSLSLKNFGISDVSLATLASQCGESDTNFEMDEPAFKIGVAMGGLDQYKDSRHLLNVSRDDYESLPKLMKGLVSWEDLLVAVEKINSYIATKKIRPGTFRQDEIELLELESYRPTTAGQPNIIMLLEFSRRLPSFPAFHSSFTIPCVAARSSYLL